MTIASAKPVHRHAHLRRIVAGWSRILHLYLSMVSFAVVLFFSVTGITLNHQNWFAGQQKTSITHGQASSKMLGDRATTGDAANVDKLGLVEMLRAQGVRGSLSDLRVDDTQIEISFKAPGYTADAFVDRDSGKYDITETRNGFVAVINDLHKGRDSGNVWSALIDISAGLLVLVSATGIVLIWFMHKRRTVAFVLVAAGAGLCIVLYRFFVP